MPFHIQCYTKQLQASSSFAAHANILANAKDAAAAAAAAGADVAAGSAASAAVPLVHWERLCPRYGIAVLQDHEHDFVVEVADVEVATNYC